MSDDERRQLNEVIMELRRMLAHIQEIAPEKLPPRSIGKQMLEIDERCERKPESSR